VQTSPKARSRMGQTGKSPKSLKEKLDANFLVGRQGGKKGHRGRQWENRKTSIWEAKRSPRKKRKPRRDKTKENRTGIENCLRTRREQPKKRTETKTREGTCAGTTGRTLRWDKGLYPRHRREGRRIRGGGKVRK